MTSLSITWAVEYFAINNIVVKNKFLKSKIYLYTLIRINLFVEKRST